MNNQTETSNKLQQIMNHSKVYYTIYDSLDDLKEEYEVVNFCDMNMEEIKSDITKFSFSVGGMRIGNSYQIVRLNNYYVLVADNREQIRDVSACYLNQAFMDNLQSIIDKNNLEEWDGFAGNDPDVLDGESFYMQVGYDEKVGKHDIMASGNNSFPKGYGDVSKQLDELFLSVVKSMRAKIRQDRIDNGMYDTQIEDYMINFTKHGNSGRDSYSIFMLPYSEDGRANVDIQIKADSGEFGINEDVRLFGYVKDEYLPYKEITEIVKKYNLVDWDGYDETAEDYNNEEWFQISFGFESGVRIEAMGTKHPEKYEEFRKEILELIVGKLDTIEKHMKK